MTEPGSCGGQLLLSAVVCWHGWVGIESDCQSAVPFGDALTPKTHGWIVDFCGLATQEPADLFAD
jgi:hypothetical protein